MSESSPPNSRIAPRADARSEHVTTSGIRFVGEAARLAEQALANRALPAGRDEDVLWAARFQLRPRLGSQQTSSVLRTVLGALDAAIRRDWEDAPPLLPDRPLRRPEARFRGLSWDTIGEPGAWTGELAWRHPHPVVAGAPLTTHVVIVEQHGHLMLTVRTSADQGAPSVRGLAGAGQARPAFISDLNRSLRLTWDGGDDAPRPLGDADIDAFVRDVLLSETRDHPVAVLAPLEGGGYLVPPAEIAEELLGLAHLYVIDRHPATFRLSDSVGDRRLSVYWGALRAYMPDFTCADRTESHPLLIRDRVTDPVMRAELVGTLGRFARTRIPRPDGVAERRPAPATLEAPARAVAAAESVPVPASEPAERVPVPARETATLDARQIIVQAPALEAMPALLAALGAQIGQLASTLGTLMEANRALADEIARLRTTTAVRASNTMSLERRLDGIERALRGEIEEPGAAGTAADAPVSAERPDEDSDDEPDRLALVDVLRQAASANPDTLLVLDSAERAAERSPYEDVDRLAVILDAMAAIARRRQEGALGTSLRAAFREVGIDYRGFTSPATSDKHRRQYLCLGADGRPYDCREHIVLGTSYDPRHCLRIYFTSRASVEPRFVIGHVGRHFDVATTS